MYEKVVEACRYLLLNSPDAEESLAYLNSRLTPESQKQYSFGYFPNNDNLHLLTSFISKEDLINLKLLNIYDTASSLYKKKTEASFFNNHPLILPYRDLYGNIVALVGRTLLSEEEKIEQKVSKYKNTLFRKGHHVFGLNDARSAILDKDCVIVVEGQFDVIKSREKGIYNIVAAGTSSLSDYQLSLICRFTDNVFLLFDNDNAGELGSTKVKHKYDSYAKITNSYLPIGYKDIDEYLSNNSADSLQFLARDVRYDLQD